MQFHHIRAKTRRQREIRIGRGGKRGTYSGRGIKGLGARAGGKFRPAERDLLKKIPKLRGYRFKSFRPQPVTVNLDAIEKVFKQGDAVTPESLLKSGLIRTVKGRVPPVKILARGEIKKKLTFKGVLFSGSAKKKTG